MQITEAWEMLIDNGCLAFYKQGVLVFLGSVK